MQRIPLDDAQLACAESGSGEPLLLIHGGLIPTFFPRPAERALAERYRVITYCRRGYDGSSAVRPPFTIGQQAADAKALLRHLGIDRAHVAGHSYGGVVAVQLALDAPQMVGSLALLEPALIALIPSAAQFFAALGSIQAMYTQGDRTGATGAFLAAVLGEDYRQLLDNVLPPGTFELAAAGSDTLFEVEVPALQQWTFTPADAKRLRQPVLSVVGEESIPACHEVHALLRQWIPHAEELAVPHTNHALPYMSPGPVSAGLARFLERHPL
jgi:pimeloyl-ACP methyl ester carboxylesterase